MFTINDKEYELKFSTGRAKLIEKSLDGEGIAHAMLANDGMMSITAIETFFSFGLKEAGADVFVAPKFAQELCEKYMDEHGYMATVQMLQLQIKEDLGFLFRME